MKNIKVLSWDWKDQPDLEKIGEMIRSFPDGCRDLREVDTGGDSYAIVLSDAVMSFAEAQQAFEAME